MSSAETETRFIRHLVVKADYLKKIWLKKAPFCTENFKNFLRPAARRRYYFLYPPHFLYQSYDPASNRHRRLCLCCWLQCDVFKTVIMLIHVVGVVAFSAVLMWQIGTHDGPQRSPDIVSAHE